VFARNDEYEFRFTRQSGEAKEFGPIEWKDRRTGEIGRADGCLMPQNKFHLIQKGLFYIERNAARLANRSK